MRHAKSSWKYDVGDQFRPLKKVGVAKTIKVANRLQKIMQFTPENMYSSPAKRAFDTATIFVENFHADLPPLEVVDDLYDFGGSQLIHFIKHLPSDVNSVMIFGHNNAFTNFVNSFGSISIDNVPTSGLVIIEFDISDWKLLRKGKTILTLFPSDCD